MGLHATSPEDPINTSERHLENYIEVLKNTLWPCIIRIHGLGSPSRSTLLNKHEVGFTRISLCTLDSNSSFLAIPNADMKI